MIKSISLLMIFLLVFSTLSITEAISITKAYNMSRSKDHFYMVLEVSDSGTLYYALSTIPENIRANDLINPTSTNFVN